MRSLDTRSEKLSLSLQCWKNPRHNFGRIMISSLTYDSTFFMAIIGTFEALMIKCRLLDWTGWFKTAFHKFSNYSTICNTITTSLKCNHAECLCTTIACSQYRVSAAKLACALQALPLHCSPGHRHDRKCAVRPAQRFLLFF